MKVAPIHVMRNESAAGGRRSSRIALVEEGEAEIASAVLPEGQGFDSPLPKINRMFQSEKKGEVEIGESPSPQTKHKRVKSAKVHNTKDIHNSWYAETEHPTNWIFKEDLPNFPSETKSLRVLNITWNLHGKKPKEDLLSVLFNKEVAKHHIIAIGTEECLRSIPMSTLYESKSYWVNLLRNHLSPEYVMIKSHSMNALHLTLFVHKELASYVKNIESSQVATGIGNFIGNKGGIGITFTLYGASFLFVNCHLASGQKQAAQRNADFSRIMTDMELPKARVAQEKKMKQRTNLVDRFDAVFWSGDFNYRVNQTRENTVQMIKEKNLEFLMKDDQMLIERKSAKVFQGFEEGEIKFAPTYKYQGGTNLYDNKKKRTPSWTDRILYYNRRKNGENEEDNNKPAGKTTTNILNYETIQSLVISDHRPVFGQFEVTYKETPEPVDENEKFVKVKTNACSIF